jgi:hypothetical protein
LDEIARLLEKNGIKRVPIVRNGKIVGIVDRPNRMQALVSQKTPRAPIVSRIGLDTLEGLKMTLPKNERRAPARIVVYPQAAREMRARIRWRKKADNVKMTPLAIFHAANIPTWVGMGLKQRLPCFEF